MNDNDKRKFHEIMTGTGEAYGKEITKPLLTIYFSALGDYTIDQVSQSINKHLVDTRNGQYFPKPADIVRNIAGASISTEDRAMAAWMAVEAAISSVGSYGTLKLEDKQAMMAVKAIGSWQQLCATDRDKMAFKRQEFIANYRALENTPIEMLPDSLAGIAELANQRREKDVEVTNLMVELAKREGGK